MIPYVVLPDHNGELTEVMVDTTPIINRLEDDYRSVLCGQWTRHWP